MVWPSPTLHATAGRRLAFLAVVLGSLTACKKSTNTVSRRPVLHSSDSQGPAQKTKAGDSQALAMITLRPKLWGFPTHNMGFALDDDSYLKSIPADARRVPVAMLDGSLFFTSEADRVRTLKHDQKAVTKAPEGILSFRGRETEFDGDYGLRKVAVGKSGDYDQWYLLDVRRFVRGVVSVHRTTKRTFYFQVDRMDDKEPPTYAATPGENCYKCHPSGLRTIIPAEDDPEVDWALLEQMNKRILDLGLQDYGDSIDFADHGKPLERCDVCHDGEDRGHLYATHLPPIRYKLEKLHAMPPDEPLDEKETAALIAELKQRRKTTYDLEARCRKIRHYLRGHLTGGSSSADEEVALCVEEINPLIVDCLLSVKDGRGVDRCISLEASQSI